MGAALEKSTHVRRALAAVWRGKGPIQRKWLFLAAAAAIFMIAAVLVFRGRGRGRGEAAYLEAPVERRTIASTLTGSGTLLPANSYTVTTLVEGDILTADFEEGDLVEKDTVLYEIDSSDAANNIEKSQISLNQAQRNYADAADSGNIKAAVSGTLFSLAVEVGDEVSPGQEIAVIRDSATMKLTVPFPADDAKGFYTGQAAEVLLDGSFETLEGTVCAVSGTFTYQAESTVAAGLSGTVAAVHVREGSSVSKGQTLMTLGGDALENSILSARDSLRNAELSMDSTQNQLDNYTITSPIEGTVVDKQYKSGDTVESGKTLCTIYDLSYLEMTMDIDELDIGKVAVGQSVQITAEAAEGRTYTGVITKVSVLGTTSGGVTSYPATVRIEETEGLRPGMNVDAEIVLEQAENVLAVPVEAVSRGNLVLITEDSPSASGAEEREAPEGYVYVSVEAGVSDDSYAQILSGLQEGDTAAYIPSSGDSGMMVFGGMGGVPMGGGMPGGGPGDGMGGGPGR